MILEMLFIPLRIFDEKFYMHVFGV